jgi:hypothetical protein
MIDNSIATRCVERLDRDFITIAVNRWLLYINTDQELELELELEESKDQQNGSGSVCVEAKVKKCINSALLLQLMTLFKLVDVESKLAEQKP